MSRHDPITPAQLDFIRALARDVGVAWDLVKAEADTRFELPVHRLNRGEASAMIDWLAAIKEGHAPRPVAKGQMSLFGDGGR